MEDCLLGQVQQVDAAGFIACEEVVVAVAGRGKSSDVIGVQRVLRVVFPESALVVAVLALLLDFEQPETEVVEDGFGEDLCDEAVGLREVVLSVVRVADLPLLQVHFPHCSFNYNKITASPAPPTISENWHSL